MLAMTGGGEDAAEVFEFVLAQDLGLTLGQVRGMPHREYVEWRSFYKARHAVQTMQEKARRAGR